MREFKFRGKGISDGDWMIGDLVTVVNVGTTVKRSFIHLRLSDIGFVQDALTAQICLHEVDYESVGQYTGLKDMNGKEIYEGDIIKELMDISQLNFWSYVVKYDDKTASYFFEDKDGIKYSANAIDFSQSEVIGNICENPELLGETNE